MDAPSTAQQIADARVLIVDDDPILRLQLHHLAMRYVSDIRVACDGEEGLAVWREWQPNVVVTDILMPRMNGIEMSQAIKSEDPDAQIIVITSGLDTNYLRQALEIGVERYISKPIDTHLLADAIRKCVRDRRQNEELRLNREVATLTRELQAQLSEKAHAEEALRQEKAEQQVLIRRLEDAHNQLLQSEKMASLGQLAAGVAHEINNPVGFVTSNLGTLRQYAERLLGLLEIYGRACATLPPDSPLHAEIEAARQAADADYLQQDMLDLIAESYEGVNRVRRIVMDLKTFSHADTGTWDWADVHQGLDSSINLANYEFKQRVTVVKDYGELPLIECQNSQLNQVFLNLVVNAAQAIEGTGTITIRTGAAENEVWIRIGDTGVGIPPENLNRIFDPFFSTKPIGAGTGLGLSISYGIIAKHHGRIEVESEVGRGTEFILTLPIRQTPQDA